MLQASAQAVDFKVGRYFGEGQRAHAGLAHFYEYPLHVRLLAGVEP